MSKSKTEKKLLKNAHKFEELEKELQLIYPPKVFAMIEALCMNYLESQRFDYPSRELVSKLAFVLRQETFARFGHESLETIALTKLLRQVDRSFKAPPPRLDSISHMKTYHINHRLDSSQEGAATHIKSIWTAFGRFRMIGSRGMDGGGGGGGQVLHPLDVMGQELWEHYQKHYIPWYQKVQFVPVNRQRYSPGVITLAAVVFKVLVEDFFPEELDKQFALVKGSAYRALRAALAGYWEQAPLDAFIESQRPRPKKPQDVLLPPKGSSPTAGS